ncbi:hypothetical protein KW782_00505 [Candidatus Parcubacteria bacterium]|nr:hypothetical protein [Candidatus Parcubacteria bacterium]
MINIQTKQHIRFAKVEQPTAWVIVAILLETTGDETVAISEPRIVKVIPKNNTSLKAGFDTRFILNAPVEILIHTAPFASPYANLLFGSRKSNFITGLAARPPTTV